MKTAELLWKFNRFIGRCEEGVRRFGQAIFGNVSWRRPGWLSRTSTRWNRFHDAHPRLVLLAVIAFVLLCCGGAWTWNWYSHLPKPKRVTAKILLILTKTYILETKF